ncbi:MAG: RNA polymerase sigma factor [Actinomycetes bacterium]
MDAFAETLAEAQAGEEKAFTELFRALNPAVVRYLTVLAGTSLAEDLAAETWLAALRTFATFEGDERALRAWLMTIARARWVDTMRARARKPELVVDTAPETPAADDVAAQVEVRFTTDWALSVIATLPADQAEVVTLRVVAQLDVPEVAELTGKTANHVRVLTHRGLRRLAKVLGEKGTL